MREGGNLWSIEVLTHLKTRASFVPRFNFGGLFFDKKFGVQIANVQKISIFAKNNDFLKKSQGYSFQRRERERERVLMTVI